MPSFSLLFPVLGRVGEMDEMSQHFENSGAGNNTE